MRRTFATLAVGMLAAASPAGAQSQARQQVEVALIQSPLLQERLGSVQEQVRFIDQTRALLRDLGRDVPDELSAADATRELEAFFFGTTVEASVTSEPPELDVLYRRATDPEGTELVTTTPGTVDIQAALWVFRATDPHTGKVEEKRILCASGCTVRFSFPPP